MTDHVICNGPEEALPLLISLLELQPKREPKKLMSSISLIACKSVDIEAKIEKPRP